MNMDDGSKIQVILVRDKLRKRRSIIFQSPENLPEPGISSFCQMKFLQIISNTSIPVSPPYNMVRLESLNRHRAVRSRVAQNLDSIRLHSNFYRFTDIITLMVYGISQSFLYGRIRIVEETVSLSSVRMLYDFLLDDIVPDISQGIPELLM